jgi:mannitol/fructose-specific phosphotransferase system IIA component (Ntr-type)
MAVGIAQQPIDFQSVDGRPVSIVILLVSPVDQTGPHVQALACVSKLMLDADFKSHLEHAVSSQEAYKLLSTHEG